MTDGTPGFEVEAPSIGEFLRLLKERSEEIHGWQGHGATGKTVFVARMTDRQPSSYGFPLVRRYVVAAFAYGSDRVSFTRTISNTVELPETIARIEDRQQVAYEEVRAEIERGLKDADFRVPVREGLLHHVPANGR